jgi:thioredoxin:protein disulfide reductase
MVVVMLITSAIIARITMLKRFSYLIIFFYTIFFFFSQPIHAESAGVNIFTEDSKKNSDEDFLPPDQAFKLSVVAASSNLLQAQFTVVPGYYLYNQRIKFSIKDASQGTISAVDLPKGEIKVDPNFGKMEVYHHDFVANIHVANAAKNLVLDVTYQGCSEKGLCYAPQHKTYNLSLPNEDNVAQEVNKGDVTLASNSDDQATTLLKGGKLWLIVAGFFGFGLLLALTPCVLPMIPILSGIIVGDKKVHHHATSRLHAFNLSLAYVLGMALSYTLAGIAAGLSGQLLSNALQSPWILAFTALIFVFLAFSMFGFYELRLPHNIENRMVNTANKLKGGQFLGVFSMGAISALIVSPCVAAPLAGALLYIGQTHDVVLGGVALFALSIGMGVPLLLIGASAGHVLPKAGPWMNAVRNLFGVLMLAMAAYIVWPALPHSFSQPINNLLGINTKHLAFKRIKSVSDLDNSIQLAKGKTVMLDFYADWCTSCKEMEKLTFSDAKVRSALKNTVLLQADVTANNDDDQALLKRFGLFGPPGIIFFNRSGQEIKPFKIIGFQESSDFLKVVNRVNSLKADECNPQIVC